MSGLVPAAALSEGPAPRHLEVCEVCHGTSGHRASPDVPHLAAQPASYLVRQLLAFQSGERKSPVMQAIAVQLGVQDVRDLAQYWSRQPVVDPVAGAAPAGLPSGMQMPPGFPTGFTAYDRAQHASSHTVTVRYANAAALDAARTARPLPSGAIVMSADYRAVLGPDRQPLKDADGQWQLGELRSLAGMETRTGWGERVPALLRNGDWNYGLWSPAGEPWLRGSHAQCLACHRPQAATQHVFTWAALSAPARP